ncbi:MAG: 2-phosphosulfolactate phosphatase family protein [Synechococcales bacterium]|nr:2-phosphosulfolactate phosphatase family protein [Synechococcales bacterium]
MKLFVFHTPEQTPIDGVPDCAIAVDVLRATTTISAALANGAEAVQTFSSIDTLMQTSDQWPPSKRVLAGERGGAKLDNFDLGNSPLDCTPERVQGKRLFLSTTNGTRCLERISAAKAVLAAALVNRHVVVDYLLANRPEVVWIVGSGWEGSYSLEDTVCAGAIAHALTQRLEQLGAHSLEETLGNDEVMGAIALYLQWSDQLLTLMSHASHGKRLLRLDCHDDLKFCAQTDVLDILPYQREAGVLVSHPS